MNEEEYLNLFKKVNKDQDDQQYQNLNEVNNNQQYQRLNETPDLSQYKIQENVNDGWGGVDFGVEVRVNGQPTQREYQRQFGAPQRRNRGGGLNGLDQYLDDEINEVYRPKNIQQHQPQHQQQIQPIIPQNISDVEVVSLELFESINQRAMLSLAGRTQSIDPNRVSGGGDTQIRYINS